MGSGHVYWPDLNTPLQGMKGKGCPGMDKIG